MANPEHLEIIRKGVKAWNDWRNKYPGIQADLSGAHLHGADLTRANLIGANLSDGYFNSAEFESAILMRANFNGAHLLFANFRFAQLNDVNFNGADLGGAQLMNVKVSGATFQQSMSAYSVFSGTDLSKAKGLHEVVHRAPSTIGIDTLYASHGSIPDEFLRGAGVPEDVITHLLPLIRKGPPIQFYSCFISYSGKDEEFAHRLHERMRAAGLRVWFAPEDMKGGDKLLDQIERAIQLHDRLLLVLSDDSILSEWVMTEIRRAREAERKEGRRKLFPITLTDFHTLKEWKCPDSKSGQDLAEEVRQYFIPDFSNWKKHDAFEQAFDRLLRDLKAEEDRDK